MSKNTGQVATNEDFFDLFLPAEGVVDANGLFLEEAPWQQVHTYLKPEVQTRQQPINASPNTVDNGNYQQPKRKYNKAALAAKPVEEEDSASKKAKRRRQIAEASRMSRARRKRELEDLRDENIRLRDERAQFLSKISELQMKVEQLREMGSTDMRIENELLRAQLDEHKRFVACFQKLSDGAPTSVNAKHAIYRQGADTAQAHVLGLVSQSQVDNWKQATVPDEADLPYQNFSVFYKHINEYGTKKSSSADSGSQPQVVRQRLLLRVDVIFPGVDANDVAEFFWTSFSQTDVQQRLLRTKGVELTPLKDDMPDKDTKMVYYREKWDNKPDQDMVLICNRTLKDLAKSTLALPGASKSKTALGKVHAHCLATSTTQHASAPEFDKARRITSLFVQGAIVWNVVADSRLCVVFSFPDDIKLKAVEELDDIVDIKTGMITLKFCEILKEYKLAMGEKM